MGRILPRETRGDDKDKSTTIILALLTGWFGGHRLYLGEYKEGIANALFFWTTLPFWVSLIDVFKYIRMNDDDWEEYLDSATKAEAQIDKKIAKKERKQKMRERWRDNRDLILVDKFKDHETGVLKVEEWSGGGSKVDGSVDIDGSSKGKSRGVNVSMFSASKSKSTISAEGDISATISDNSFEAKIDALAVNGSILEFESEKITFDIDVLDISNVYRTDSGIIVEADGTTFRIDGISTSPVKADRAIQSAKEEHQPEESAEEEQAQNSNGELSEKLEELQELNDDGVLSDEEFESKKEELLDEY